MSIGLVGMEAAAESSFAASFLPNILDIPPNIDAMPPAPLPEALL